MASTSTALFVGIVVGIVGGGTAGYFLAPRVPVASNSTEAPAEPFHGNDPVVAKVNGSPIYKSDVDGLIHDLGDQAAQMPEAELRSRVTERLIDVKLAAAKANDQRLDLAPNVRRRISATDLQILADAYLDRTAREKIDDDVVKAKYDELVKQVPPTPEVHARHILVKSEAEAKDIIKQLDKGADFEKLAKEKSTDPGSGESGGDLGYFTKDKMVPEFADAAFKMEKNEYSKTPVHSQFGWHVIQVLDKRNTPPPPFEEVKAQLTNVVLQEREGKILADLHAGAKIELFNADGTPVVPGATPAAQPASAPPAPPAAPPAK